MCCGFRNFLRVKQPYIAVQTVLLLFSFKRSQVLLLNSRFRCGRGREIKKTLPDVILNADVQPHIPLSYFSLLKVGTSSFRNF